MSSTIIATQSLPVLAPEAPERRRCWECLRRRLVCDAVKPVCNKCRVAGIVCPGYDDKKPLTWLAPGKVTCRTRRKSRVSENDSKAKSNTSKSKENQGKTIRKEKEIRKVSELIFHSALRTDVCDVYEAVQYYNAVFYPYTKSGHSDNKNVYIDQIPLGIVKYLPTAIAHNLVAVVFQHRMCVQTQWKLDCPSAKHAEARLHHHRGISIRALNEDIANERTQSSDAVLTGVILLLQSEITACISPNWRHHVAGILAMLACRGGPTVWMQNAPFLNGVLLSFFITIITANTTSPSLDQVELCPPDELMALVKELYPMGLHPYMPCPTPLFLEMVRINNLRVEIARGLVDKETARHDAEDIIMRIEAFHPDDAVPFYEKKEHNDFISFMFQSAMAIYCISSLQGLGGLPRTHRLAAIKAAHSDHLFFLLSETRKDEVLKKSVGWPLMVAGFEAGARVDKRQFLRELIVEQSKDIGTPLPLYAIKALRKFWDGESTDWDVCFDQPYAFMC
ncbi:hypothetical protein EsH8_III_000086 [Colletotrichum jinshuiense]